MVLLLPLLLCAVALLGWLLLQLAVDSTAGVSCTPCVSLLAVQGMAPSSLG